MENITKAFYIAGATLIAVFIMFLMVYMFRQAARVGENYETSEARENVDKFNSQFTIYDTSELDRTSGEGTNTDPKVASDVVSAVNLAYNINEKNNNDPVNFVEIYVYWSSGSLRYSLLNNENAKKNTLFEGTDTSSYISTNKFLNLEVDSGKFLNDTRLDETTNKVIYRYYFTGRVSYNDNTGRVNRVDFTLNENADF